MSLWAYGLTPPRRWKERTDVLADIVTKVMEPRLAAVKIGLGSQGREKLAADAVGVLFNHTRSFLGLPHGHSHVFVPNVAGTADGHYGSIRNAREVLFRQQGEMRAEAHKRLDDYLQAKGYATVRVGNTVGLKGIPDEMVRELSPAKEGQTTTQEAERPFVKEAWADLGKAVKGLGQAVFIATAKKATEAVNHLAEAVNPRPRVLRVTGDQLEGFVKQYRPRSRVVAHAKAALTAVFASGNPHERAAAAERKYKELRSHDRLRKNTVIVVSRSERATARELHLLAKIARRDKCSVVLAERTDRSRSGNGRPPHGMPRDKAHRHGGGKADPAPWKYQFRGPGREYER